MEESGKFKQLDKLIEEMTTSGSDKLSENHMKALKKMCKQSDKCVVAAYHMLFAYMQKRHAEIRLSCVQIVDELFSRSHQFRTLVLDKFKEYIDLTIGNGAACDLPPPKPAANKLKKLSLSMFKNWKEKYGDSYKKIHLGLTYMKTFKKLDLERLDSLVAVQDKKHQQQAQQHKKLVDDTINLYSSQMKDKQHEIEFILKQLDNCIALLIPRLDEFLFNDLHEDEVDLRTNNNDRPLMENAIPCNDMNETHSSINNSNMTVEQIEVFQNVDSDDIHPIMICPIANSDDSQNDDIAGTNLLHVNLTSGNDIAEPSNVNAMSYNTKQDGYCENNSSREHGYRSGYFSIPINIDSNQIIENDDNSDIIVNLMELKDNLVKNYLSEITKWASTFQKYNCSESLINISKELLENIELSIKKVDALNIVRRDQPKNGDHKDCDSDDEFEDVPDKDGYEADIPDYLKEKSSCIRSNCNTTPIKNPLTKQKKQEWNLKQLVHLENNDIEDDPTSMHTNLKKMNSSSNFCHAEDDSTSMHTNLKKVNSNSSSNFSHANDTSLPSGSKDEEKFAIAPIIPYGVDQHDWGVGVETPMIVTNNFDTHRFWRPPDPDVAVNKEALLSMQTRVIRYVSKHEPITQSCKAPMPNGSLCPRKDKEKCPFHGKIVSRDDNGIPTDRAERNKFFKEQTRLAELNHNWEDPDVQKEIEMQTGIKLTKDKKGKSKSKGGKHRGLTSLNLKNSRKRLEKIVFNKNTLRRVCESLNHSDQKRVGDKFANQFNYA